MKTTPRGQILPVIMVTLLVMALVVAALVNWAQIDTKSGVDQQKNTSAINLAEAGIDRGTWKLQSSTSTWAQAAAGTVLSGYNFDSTYSDVPGGTYRIKFTNGVLANGNATVTITSEGRDSLNRQTRAVQAVFESQTIYSAIMSGGNVSWGQGLGVYWGPIMAQGNLQLMDDNVARRYFPRKFAQGVVIGTAANPRDTNGLNPPNTDNVEWWSAYSGVPPVPVLDFVSMRSSAAVTGTLNVYGCASSAQYTLDKLNAGTGNIDHLVVPGWDARATCNSTYPNHAIHLGNSTNFYAARGLVPNQDYVWYWDGDVSLEGQGYNGTLATSLRGSIIVRGNLTIDSSGDMVYWGHVPTNAWQEEQKLLIDTFDTAASGEYPADIGYHTSTGSWHFGADSWNEPGLGGGWVNTVGIKGFVYVGGNLSVINFLDIHGAVWVNGSVSSSYASATSFCGIFYDETLQVPTLNVILQRLSWQEIGPSTTAWH